MKKISMLCASALCLAGLCTAAYAENGVVGNAVNGVIDAGDDIANGVINAGEDIVNGVTGDNNNNSPDNNGGTTNENNSANNGTNAIGDTSDITESGAANGIDNPVTGVSLGYTAVTAVLAAMGVTLSSIRRKHD